LLLQYRTGGFDKGDSRFRTGGHMFREIRRLQEEDGEHANFSKVARNRLGAVLVHQRGLGHSKRSFTIQ